MTEKQTGTVSCKVFWNYCRRSSHFEFVQHTSCFSILSKTWCRWIREIYVWNRLYNWYYMPSSVHAWKRQHLIVLSIGQLSEEAQESRNKNYKRCFKYTYVYIRSVYLKLKKTFYESTKKDWRRCVKIFWPDLTLYL